MQGDAVVIEPEKRYSRTQVAEYRWTCSLCNKKGPWERSVTKVLDDGEKHAKSEHGPVEKEGN